MIGASALAGASACSLDFDVSGRDFDCPPHVIGCQVCNADGSCRIPLPVLGSASGATPGAPTSPPLSTPDASVVVEQPSLDPPLEQPPPMEPAAPDAGAPPVDAGHAEPLPDVCREYATRTSDSLCLGAQQCFSLGSVLSPALVAWLDPTTLPEDGSRHWCDRSGQQHHALLQPEGGSLAIGADGRAVSAELARSVLLDRAWLTLGAGTQPVLGPGNFAVVLAAVGLPEEPSDAGASLGTQPFELFESGERSRINLTLVPSSGRLEGTIASRETALVTSPVVTQSSVYDGVFHLFSLYRRSEVRVLDDVLQLRLNGTLEFRGSSIAIPRALDLGAGPPPRIGARTGGANPTGRGRIAAAILFRGAIPEDELARLETFLCTALAVCGAPQAPGDAPGAPVR